MSKRLDTKLDTDSKISFGARLRALRLQSAYPTASGFAEACGVSRATLYLWEDSSTPPPPKHWDQLCAVLGISQQHLLLGNSSVSSNDTQSVQENSAYYGVDPTTLARNILEEALHAAGNDNVRVSWIVEQLRLHLRPPAHWLQGNTQPSGSLLVARQIRKLDSYREQTRAAAISQKNTIPQNPPNQKSA